MGCHATAVRVVVGAGTLVAKPFLGIYHVDEFFNLFTITGASLDRSLIPPNRNADRLLRSSKVRRLATARLSPPPSLPPPSLPRPKRGRTADTRPHPTCRDRRTTACAPASARSPPSESSARGTASSSLRERWLSVREAIGRVLSTGLFLRYTSS
jgi:hypothetical protein